MKELKTTALLILGGELDLDLGLLSTLVRGADLIVCADSGAQLAIQNKIGAHVVIGDFDSISPEALEYARTEGWEVVHESEQESTDFEKAFRWLERQGAKSIRVVGIGGGRSDHLLTNFSVMLKYTVRFDSIIAYDAANAMSFQLPAMGELSIKGQKGTRVSLVPFPKATGIITHGLLYALNGETLEVGVRDGLSNRIVDSTGATLSFSGGALLIAVEHRDSSAE